MVQVQYWQAQRQHAQDVESAGGHRAAKGTAMPKCDLKLKKMPKRMKKTGNKIKNERKVD